MADEPLDPIASAVVSSAERLGVRYMVTGMYAGNHWLWRHDETRTLGGREMRLQRPEDIITVKVLLGRPKDIRDIRLLDRLPDLDRRHLARWLGRLGLTEAYRLAVGGAAR